MEWPNWRNDVVAVVASGPSAVTCGVGQLRDVARVIAVNNSYLLVPWADVLYATDREWWDHHVGAASFGGLRVTSKRKVCRRWPGVEHFPVVDKMDHRRATIVFQRGFIGSGGNSGFQALNLAVQFGARRIILVGFDMTLANGSHWHGDHKGGLFNPQRDLMAKWARVLDGQAIRLRDAGVEVVNASPASALQNYRKESIEETLVRWGRITNNAKVDTGGLSTQSQAASSI